MRDVLDNYRETFEECRLLLNAAFQFSTNTQGRVTTSRGIEVGSWLFAKLTLHVNAVLNLAPKGPLGLKAQEQEAWDVSSMAVLVRAEIDTYYTFFYVAVDQVEDEIRDFRWLLWDHHSEIRRLEKLRLIGSNSPKIQEIEKTVCSLTERIQNHSVYLNQAPAVQRKLRKGDLGIFSTNTDLSKSAGIDPAYYKAMFMFLSSYVHSHPFSLDQLAIFRANDEESLRLISVVLRYAAVYLSLALRDFMRLMPDQRSVVPTNIMNIIDLWCGIAGEYSEKKHR